MTAYRVLASDDSWKDSAHKDVHSLYSIQSAHLGETNHCLRSGTEALMTTGNRPVADRKDGHQRSGIMKRQWKAWKTSDLKLLRDKINKWPMELIARELGRNQTSIYWKAHQLGLLEKQLPAKKWNAEEDRRLEEGIASFVDWDRVARLVGRTAIACQIRSSKRKLIRKYNFWTDDRKQELLRLREQGMGCKRIAEHFDVTQRTIYLALDRYEMRN